MCIFYCVTSSSSSSAAAAGAWKHKKSSLCTFELFKDKESGHTGRCCMQPFVCSNRQRNLHRQHHLHLSFPFDFLGQPQLSTLVVKDIYLNAHDDDAGDSPHFYYIVLLAVSKLIVRWSWTALAALRSVAVSEWKAKVKCVASAPTTTRGNVLHWKI